MLTHGDWHDFTLSVLKCKEIRKIYRDHPYCPKILKLYHIILPLCFYISFTLHNNFSRGYLHMIWGWGASMHPIFTAWMLSQG